MVARCTDPNDKGFAAYGGRGITVDDRWRSFTNFIHDMGRRPKGLMLERIDNDGPYAKHNCRWATRLEQANNTRCTLRFGGLAGARALAEKAGVSVATIYNRRWKGWDRDRLLAPNQNQQRKG